jgi:hypothetical protein
VPDITTSSLFQIGDLAGFTPQIGRLVSMMNYTRFTTVEAVDGLTIDHLDFLYDEQSNSIGALLLHIAAVEFWFQVHTFFNRDLHVDEVREWGAGLDLGEAARREVRGHDLPYYLGRLERVRARTLDEFARRDDSWLEELGPFGHKRYQANNYFKRFHVTEDELSHRGQIRWLRKRIAV